MKNKYKATFVTTAEVVVEFEVEAENQQEGLVTAHDFIRQVGPAQAKVVKLNLDSALNTGFERLASQAETLPPSPLALAGKFKVQFFHSGEWGPQPVVTSEYPSFETAKTVAESVLLEGSAYGSSLVLDEMGLMVVKTRASRGDWEVEAYDTSGNLVERHTWQADRSTAKATALALLDRRDVSFVRIFDYSLRSQGPVLWKEVR